MRVNHPIHFLVLMRFHKPIGIFLLLWPTLWALWIAAKGLPPFFFFIIFLIGTIIMRTAGCVINDIADRHIDRHVKRTRKRPLTSGKLTLTAAITLFIVLYAVAFSLVCLLNTLSIQLSIVAAGLAVIYPFSKRFTHWPQLILGLAFSWGIPMAFAAVTQRVPMIAWLLFATNVLWTITYDTEYAMTDRVDDIKIGIKSTALLFGKYDRVMIALLQILVLILLSVIGIISNMHWPYYFSLIIAMFIFVYHDKLLAQRHPQACLKAFINNNWIGLTIFLGIIFSYGI